jgi:hypothetical protein
VDEDEEEKLEKPNQIVEALASKSAYYIIRTHQPHTTTAQFNQ